MAHRLYIITPSEPLMNFLSILPTANIIALVLPDSAAAQAKIHLTSTLHSLCIHMLQLAVFWYEGEKAISFGPVAL